MASLLFRPPAARCIPQPDVSITIENGDFSGPVILDFTRIAPPSGSFGSFQPSGLFYQLAAFDANNPTQPVSLLAGQSYSITLFYGDDVAGLFEPSLALYYWDGSQWVLEPTGTLDTAAQTITATPDHFSDWAILGKVARNVYLPVVMK